MKKIIYSIFGYPVAPLNSGLIGSKDGRLFIDKAIFFSRIDVQSVLDNVKKSEVVRQQIKKAKIY